MTEHTLPLGRQVGFPERYDPSLLAPIPRAESRASLGLSESLPFSGCDVWNAYELSWLNTRGKPQAAMGRFLFPAESPHLIESKSLKLYLGSFNQEAFDTLEQVGTRLQEDLSAAAGAAVGVLLQPLPAGPFLPLEEPEGDSLDGLDITVSHYTVAPELLALDEGGDVCEEVLYSDLFRSSCPVTAQPDWATVTIAYKGPRIDHAALLRYLLSFRQHCDFHESCVERIFLDIQARCQPEVLSVEANFLRRGGLDINPVRSSRPISNYEDFPRLPRQ